MSVGMGFMKKNVYSSISGEDEGIRGVHHVGFRL